MRTHLERRGFTAAHVEAAIETLTANRYLDDPSLAERRVEDLALRRGWGRHRMTFELTRRGFADSVIADAIAAVHDHHDEMELARRALHRKFPRGSSGSIEERGRAFRYLMGRGYPADIVTHILGESPED
jgi:SOS response regulatory protein OraA/RecX